MFLSLTFIISLSAESVGGAGRKRRIVVTAVSDCAKTLRGFSLVTKANMASISELSPVCQSF